MKKILSIILVLLLFAAPVWAEREDEPEREPFFTALLLGIDEGGEQSITDAEFGRADAVMLISIGMKTGRIRMLSVERDFMVELPDYGVNKLCIACYLLGPEGTLDMINRIFELDIENYGLINPEGIERIVNAIGGIEVEIDQEDLYIRIRKTGKKAFSKAGVQKINGAQARALVRTRTEDSDPVRNIRQFKVLTALYEKVSVGGLDVAIKFVTNTLPYVKTNMGFGEITAMITPLLSNDFNMPEHARVPFYDYQTKLINLHYVVVADDMEMEIEQVRAFLYGE